MAWTGFIANMKDGKQFAFGTSFLFDFFDMPKGYSPNDIAEIIIKKKTSANTSFIQQGQENEISAKE
jgi:hypothetical protein